MNYWESFKRKVFGEPLSDDELKELNDTVFNVSAKEKEKLVKESEERFQKNYLKYSIGWTLIYLGAWGFLIWIGLSCPVCVKNKMPGLNGSWRFPD